MALDGSIDKTVKAPAGDVLSSVNLNSVSDQPGAKPVQVADEGVFRRDRGHEGGAPQQPHPGGRAHPFSDTGITMDPDGKLKVGQDPSATPNVVEPFKQHVADQAPELQDMGDKMQNAVTAAFSGRIQGNAIAVGFGDNAKRNEDLGNNWALIGEQGGLQGAIGSGARVVGVGVLGFGMGTYAHGKLQRELSAEKASHVKVVDKHEEEVKALRDKTKADLDAMRTDPAKAAEATKLNDKHEFLKDYLKTEPKNKLEALSEFNKKNPAALLPADKAELKGMAETELKLSSVNKGLNNLGPEFTGVKGFYEHGMAGLKNGVKFVVGSLALNYAIKESIHLLPGNHHETDRIFTQTTQESAAQALIGAAPIRNLGTKIALGGAAWLAGREERMTTSESIVSTVGVMGATVAAGLAVPSLRSSMPKALLAEGAAFLVGRGVHMTPWLGSSIPELTNASTDAWDAMKTDSQKMSGSSFHDAVDSFDYLGTKWRGVLVDYQRDIVGDKQNQHGIYVRTLPINHELYDKLDPKVRDLNNWQNVIINGRTGMALSESVGDTVLKAGLTGDGKQDLLNSYHKQSSDDKPITDDTVIAPNQGDLDLTSRAAKNYMQALALADVTMANMKQAQQDGKDTSGKDISDDQIKALADEKAKMVTEMNEKIFRSAPGAKAHDIQDIVEASDGLIVSPNKFKLTDYANDDPKAYGHMVDALEDKAYAARDSWLPGQANGPNADIAKEYVAKIFRDAAVMRLADVNAELETQTANGAAPNAASVTDMITKMQNSDLGRQQDPNHANRDTKSVITAAWQLDKDNPDMKAIMDEYDRIAKRILQFKGNYINNHNGLAPDQDSAAKLRVTIPANAH